MILLLQVPLLLALALVAEHRHVPLLLLLRALDGQGIEYGIVAALTLVLLINSKGSAE